MAPMYFLSNCKVAKYRPLSNMHIPPLKMFNMTFSLGGEQYYQYTKIRLASPRMKHYHSAVFEVAKSRMEQILAASSPFQCKSIASKFKNDYPEWERDWNEIKYRVMVSIQFCKYENSELRTLLLGTGYRFLIEASPSDGFWGAGMGECEMLAGHQWWGKNLMGRALATVRSTLRDNTRNSI